MTEELKYKLDSLPVSPGVYLFKNKNGKIIYIGKAKILRNRVRSYFTGGDDGRSQYPALVSSICDLEIIVTETELEAIFLEANLIKEHRPRFNIFFRDDKFFPYLKVTKEKYPRVFLTRKIIDDGSEYYGPFTELKQFRRLIKTFKETFQIRNCNYHITNETIVQEKHDLCLDYHIGLCAGVCRGFRDEDDYNDNVKKLLKLAKGQVSGVIHDLKKSMIDASENMRFEEAAVLRDRLKVVEDFASRQTIISSEAMDRDVFGFACEDDDGCVVVMRVREGKVLAREHFFLKNASKNPKSEILNAFLKQFYLTSSFVPRELFLPLVPDDEFAINEWLREKRRGPVNLVNPKRGTKAKLLRLAITNAELLLGENRRKRESREKIPYSIKNLQECLNLPRLPRMIEAFDVSNISGTLSTASMVTFKNGNPLKSAYRRYNIKGVEGINDFAMIAEAVNRRYSRLLRDKEDLPDLVLIDGGKGQLSSAVTVLKDLGLKDLPVIGLAKKLEEVFQPGMSESIILAKTSSTLKLLQQIRDEAHRFAITHHRNRRSRKSLKSVLDDIAGIGPVKKAALLKSLGSTRNISKASLEKLSAVKGIDRKTAHIIVDFFKQRSG